MNNISKKLAKKLDRSESEVIRFVSGAPLKYKVYTIPKRTSGHRVIAQPSKELKEYQRAFLSLHHLDIHDAAAAYRDGLSIRDNAEKHSKNSYLLKMDLENFFNSISTKLFWNVWESRYGELQNETKVFMERLLFWSPSRSRLGRLVLSIGAPSSPALSNFFMYHFDEAVSSACSGLQITYTRYADDLTFSTNRKGVLFDIPSFITETLKSHFDHSITVNRKKTKFSSLAHNRHVTGVTLNNEGNLSLGRKKKRYIKHLVHQYQIKELNKESTLHLKGLLAFAKHIEPKFIVRLKEKYSEKVIIEIFKENNE